MPIYEYLCKQCGKHLEKRQSVTDEPLKKCEECGGDLEKQWSLSGFQFKGEGWYVTDYSKNKATEGKKAGGAEKNLNGKESTSTGDSASKQNKESASEKKPAGTGKEE